MLFFMLVFAVIFRYSDRSQPHIWNRRDETLDSFLSGQLCGTVLDRRHVRTGLRGLRFVLMLLFLFSETRAKIRFLSA
jgi:hypothetical protein